MYVIFKVYECDYISYSFFFSEHFYVLFNIYECVSVYVPYISQSFSCALREHVYVIFNEYECVSVYALYMSCLCSYSRFLCLTYAHASARYTHIHLCAYKHLCVYVQKERKRERETDRYKVFVCYNF